MITFKNNSTYLLSILTIPTNLSFYRISKHCFIISAIIASLLGLRVRSILFRTLVPSHKTSGLFFILKYLLRQKCYPR